MHRTRFTLRVLAAAGLAALAATAAAPSAASAVTGILSAASAVTGISSAASAVTGTLTAAPAVTTGHTGSGRPGLAYAGQKLYVAWAGSTGTAGKQLVIGSSFDNGQTITKDTKVVERVPAGEGPALDGDSATPAYGVGVYLAWSAANNDNTLTVAYTLGNGLACRTAFAGVRTLRSPAMSHDNFDRRFVAWVDLNNHINIGRIDITGCGGDGVPNGMVLTDRLVLPDTTAAAGPALLYDMSGVTTGYLLGWSSPDAQIHLATFHPGSATLTDPTFVQPPDALSAGGFGLSSYPHENLYLWFRTPNGEVHRGFSEGYKPASYYSYYYGQHASSGIGVASDGTRDAYAYFDLNGKLTVNQK